MDLNLKGKRAVVCGSTQGIGKSAAIELSLLGASVTLISRSEEKLKVTLSELSSDLGQQHDYIVADFNAPEELRQKVEDYAARYAVHILVNNTGGPPAGPALDAQLSEYISAFTNHLLCNQVLVQVLAPGMKKEKYGRIINIISTSVKAPIKGLGVSNTIRGAVASWAKTVASELGPAGITVNNVLPGTTMTGRLEALIRSRADKTGKTYEQIKQEMIAEVPLGRISEPQEVGSVIAFLATPAAGYINGINVPVDGGRTPSL